MPEQSPFKRLASRLLRDETGATAVEYGVMIAAIAAVIILTVASVGSSVTSAFSSVDTQMGNNFAN